MRRMRGLRLRNQYFEHDEGSGQVAWAGGGRLTLGAVLPDDRAMVGTLLQVALGGALGATARYLTGLAALRLLGPGFPWGTLTVNILGSALMGAFVALAAQRGLTHLSPLVMTGFLGGFTTFSAFSLDVVSMLERDALGPATAYVTASVLCGIVGLLLGMAAVRALA